MTEFFNWALSLLSGIYSLWNWLVTPLQDLETLTGISIAPIYLVGATAITVGIIRAIL